MDIPRRSSIEKSLKRGRSQVGSVETRTSSIVTGTPISLSSLSISYSSYRPSSYQSPSLNSSSYLADFQHEFMKDFTCCGLLLATLHDLLQHYEESHAPTQGSSGVTAKPVQEEASSYLNGFLPQSLEREQAKFQSSFGTAAKTVQKGTIPPPFKRFLGLGETSLTKTSPLSLMESIQPELDSAPENGSHAKTEASIITVRDSEKAWGASDPVDGMNEAFERLSPFVSPQNGKSFKCPVIGCERAFKNQNGLKYHKTHGHSTHMLHENEDGTFSVVNPISGDPHNSVQKEKPYKCDLCGKRYKNLNGLKYHKEHSIFCRTMSLETLAPSPPAEKPKLAVEPLISLESDIETTSTVATPQRVISNSTSKKQKLATGPIFRCEICDKSFTRAAGLREHLLRHADERPFACTAAEGCNQRFFSSKDCKRHEAIHSGEKNFVCESVAKDGSKIGCGREFGRADHLAAHRRTDAGRTCVLGHDEKRESVDEESM